MKIEVNSAADFLISLLRIRQKVVLTENQLQSFRGHLAETLTQHYQRHWYPEIPTKGSGYRCIRINGKMDPILEQAGMASGLNGRTLRKMLPQELTMWIDPDEVSYRIGENGSVCVLYDSRRTSPSSDLDSGSDEFIMERVGRIEISKDLKELILYEADSTFISRPRRKNYNRHNNKSHHHISSSNYFQHQLNNSVSSASSGHHSPPLSPNNSNLHYNTQFNNNFSSPLKQYHTEMANNHPNLFNSTNWDGNNASC